jgi:predicted nucleic acid-binding protein
MKEFLLDASFLMCLLAPDEYDPSVESIFDDYFNGLIQLYIINLTSYEILNSIKTLVLQKRITVEQSYDLLDQYLSFNFPELKVNLNEAFNLSLEHNLTFYDAAYLEVSRSKGIKLMALDKKLQKLAD